MGAVAVGTLAVVRLPHFDAGLDTTLSFDAWLRGQQAFTYEHGFIRRGLVGEVLRRLRFPDGPGPMFALFAAVYLATAALLARLVRDATAPLGRRARLVATGAVLALPFALPEAAHALGRYDGVLYLAVLPFLVWRPPPLAYAAVGFAGPLVHEAFLVVHLPLLVVALVAYGGWSRPDRRLPVLLVGGAIGTAAIVLAGDTGSMTEAELVAVIAEDVPGYASISDPGALPPHSVLYRDPAETVDLVLDRYTGGAVLGIAAVTLPLALLLWAFARLRGPGARAALLRVGAASLPACVLFLIGIDFMRWVGMVSFNALLVVLLDLRARPFTTTALHHARLPLVMVTTTVALGPVGTSRAFPFWAELLQKL